MKKRISLARKNAFASTFGWPGARNRPPALSLLLHHCVPVFLCLYQDDFCGSECARSSQHTLRRVFHFFLLFRHKPSANSRLENLLIRPIFTFPASVFVHLRAAQGDPSGAHSE